MAFRIFCLKFVISILIAFRRNRNPLYFKFSMKTVLLETGVPVLVYISFQGSKIWSFDSFDGWWNCRDYFMDALLTQLKLECKEMVLAKTRSSKVPCTVSELQSQVKKFISWFALASVLLTRKDTDSTNICSI